MLHRSVPPRLHSFKAQRSKLKDKKLEQRTGTLHLADSVELRLRKERKDSIYGRVCLWSQCRAINRICVCASGWSDGTEEWSRWTDGADQIKRIKSRQSIIALMKTLPRPPGRAGERLRPAVNPSLSLLPVKLQQGGVGRKS